jgi:RecJ-like exonuclease
VHTINALANKEKGRSITQIEAEDVGKVLKELPGLDPAARAFYLSKAYDGSMDTNILVACVIHSMLKERWGDAERFHTMVQVYNPKGDVLEVEDYLKPCKTCDKSGRIEKPCAACDGSGKCPRCGGTGERKTDFRDSTIHCTTCRGTGKCVECGGDGKKSYRCAACEGRGRMLEIQRAEIKRDLLVDEINDYFNQHPVSIPGASY